MSKEGNKEKESQDLMKESISTPIHREEWEVEFDEKFVSKAHPITGGIEQILTDARDVKSFICTLLESHHNDLIEKVAGMKRKKGSDDYVLSDQNSWYNQALNDVLSLIKNER